MLVGVDPDLQEIIAAHATNDTVADSKVIPELVDASPASVKKIAADRAYDYAACRKELEKRQLIGLILSRKNARKHLISSLRLHNEVIDMISALEGNPQAVTLWSKLSGYSKRSLVEMLFPR